MILYPTYLVLRPKQHNTTQHNTTSCEFILVLNSKTNLLFLLVSLFSLISCFFSISAKKMSFSFSHILQSHYDNNKVNIFNSNINNLKFL